MDLSIALITYLIIIITIFLLCLYFKYTGFSSFVLAIIFGFIYLMIAYPMTNKSLDDITVSSMLYMMILVLTIIILFIYTILKNITNRKLKEKFPLKKSNN